MTLPKISDWDPREIADELDEIGVVCLKRAVPSEWLEQARAEVKYQLRTHGESNHFIRSPIGGEHSAADAFIADPSTLPLLSQIMRARFSKGRAAAELTCGALRIVAGPRGEGDSWWFHYDASIVTMVVPIFLPDAGRGTSGELVGYFNKRPFRRFVLVNIVEKVATQSAVYRQVIRRRLGTPNFGRIVDMEVGNIYLFWGFRSLHANMPCESGALRATLLLHFGRPYGSSRALRTAGRVQHILLKLRGKADDSSMREIAAG